MCALALFGHRDENLRALAKSWMRFVIRQRHQDIWGKRCCHQAQVVLADLLEIAQQRPLTSRHQVCGSFGGAEERPAPKLHEDVIRVTSRKEDNAKGRAEALCWRDAQAPCGFRHRACQNRRTYLAIAVAVAALKGGKSAASSPDPPSGGSR